MKELILLEPEFKPMLWGSESWMISAHSNGDCRVKEGSYKGMKLSQLWAEHPELFGATPRTPYPLLIKVIDARDDLSIQVHPDDSYAAEHESGALGKTECWYVLDCKKGAEIVVGHYAKDHKEMEEMIRQGRWEDFIRRIPVKKGDFFQIPPGCLHAILGGTLILETQQNSDITYRVYDFDRLMDGKLRELHIEQSIDVIQAPFTDEEIQPKPVVTQLPGAIKTHYISCPFYTVEKYQVQGEWTVTFPHPFLNVSIMEGEGTLNGVKFEKDASFIIPNQYGLCSFAGKFTMMCSFV